MSAPAAVRPESPPRDEPAPFSNPALWAGVLTGPILFLVLLQVNYLLTMWSCSAGVRWPLHLATLIVLAVTVLAGLGAYRMWHRAGREWSDNAGGGRARARFLSSLGLLTSSLFATVILAQWLTVMLMDPCTRA